MFELVETSCPQCYRPSNDAASRLINDSCGHQKCRKCLLLDEEECKQCHDDKKSGVIILDKNHAGVITCNGTPKKTEVKPSIQTNGNETETNGKSEPIFAKPMLKSKCTETKNKINFIKDPLSKKGPTIVLPKHITMIQDPLQYKCNICKKQFSTKTHIKYHIYCTGGKFNIFTQVYQKLLVYL